jgi:hypothetical protein
MTGLPASVASCCPLASVFFLEENIPPDFLAGIGKVVAGKRF